MNNLFNIYKSISGESIEVIENRYKGKMYSVFKNDLSELLIDLLTPINKEYQKLMNDKKYLLKILKEGSEYAQYQSNKTLTKVYRKVGFLNKT